MGRDIYDDDQSRVTSQSDMNVTPQIRGYMRSSLQRSCYVERHSGEGGAPSVLNPLALTYHFGRATSTPGRRRSSDITGHRPLSAVKSNVADRDGMDNVILDASSGDGRGVHSIKNRTGLTGPCRRRTQLKVWRKLEVPIRRKKIEFAHSGGSPGIFFSDKTKTLLGRSIQRQETGRTIVYQNNAQPLVLRTVGGFYP